MLKKCGMTLVVLTSLLSSYPVLADSQEPNVKQTNCNPTNGSWSFVLGAQKGVFTKAGGNNYVLTLSDVDPKVLAFSGHPRQQTTFVKADNFLSYWSRLFINQKPDATVTHVDMKARDQSGDSQPMSMELSQPKQLDDGSWQFKVQTVAQGDRVLAGTFTNIEVLIN